MHLMFYKGVKVENLKGKALKENPVEMLPSENVYIPLFSLGKSAMQTTISIGQDIEKNAVIATSQSRKHNIVATCAGKLQDVKMIEHPEVGRTPFAVVEVDKQAIARKKPIRKYEDAFSMERLDLIEIAKQANIIDEYDNKPLYRKLRYLKDEHIVITVANAVDDEPYMSSGVATFLANKENVVKGLKIVSYIINAKGEEVAVYNCAREVWQTKNTILDVPIIKLIGNYPIWVGLDRHYQNKKQKYAKIGVQACMALYEAVIYGIPQTTTVVTVSGNAVTQSRNIIVPIGTPIKDLLNICTIIPSSAIKNEKQLVVMGSAIKGKEIIDTEVPILANTRCILVLNQKKYFSPTVCIGCARCSDVCPSGIIPVTVAKFYERGEYEKAYKIGVENCIQCSCCSIVCPVSRNLTEIMIDVKKLNKNKN